MKDGLGKLCQSTWQPSAIHSMSQCLPLAASSKHAHECQSTAHPSFKLGGLKRSAYGLGLPRVGLGVRLSSGTVVETVPWKASGLMFASPPGTFA